MDDSSDNVASIREQITPMVPMEAHEWGRELYKSYLISVEKLSHLAADHKAANAEEFMMEAVASAVMKSIEGIMELEDQLREARDNYYRDHQP